MAQKSPNEIAKVRGPLNGLISKRMSQLNIESIREFADYAQIGRTSLHELVRGRTTASGAWTKPSLDTLEKMAIALEKPMHELLYIVAPEAPGADAVVDATQVPVLLAGQTGNGEDGQDLIEERIYVSRSFAEGRDLLAFLIRDDSMAGGRHPIYNGDVVIIDRNLEGAYNSPVVAELGNGEFICKRLRPNNILDSTNPDYLDEEYAVIGAEQVHEMVGRVVRILSNALA